MEEGGRMLICTNYKSNRRLKLLKKMTKRKTKRKLKTKTKAKNEMELNRDKI